MFNDNCTCGAEDASDAELINCIQGSSRCQERASGRLIERYTPMIVGSAARVCRSVKGDGRVQTSDLDAARQGARIGLYDAALKFDFSRGVPFAGMAGSYVFGAARRELLLQLGWTPEGRRPPYDLLDEFRSDWVPAESSAEDAWMQRGFGQVGHAARRLGDSARSLLFEAYVEDLSITDIAQMRGVRQQTVSAQHKRALAALKAEIEKAA
jgi:RNA polymerase sigma factor (sigma-70 family)